MKKRLVVGALAAGLALTGGAVGAQELETAGKDKDHKVLRLYSRAVEGVDVDAPLVGPPGSGGMGGEPQFVDGVGYMFTESVWLANKDGHPYGDPIGQVIVECRVIGVVDPDPETDGEEGEAGTNVCEGVVRTPKGDLFLEAAFDFDDFEDGSISGGISSGSEHFEGADGGFTVTETPIEGDEEDTASVWEVRLEDDKDKHDRH